MTALNRKGFDVEDPELLSAIDRFGEMFEKLDQAERELVATLAEDLAVYHFRDYQRLLYRLTSKIDQSHVGGCTRVVFLPLA